MQSTSLRQLISNRVQNHVVTTIVQTKDPCRSVIVVNEYLKVTIMGTNFCVLEKFAKFKDRKIYAACASAAALYS